MKTNRFLVLTLIFVIVLSACSGTPTPVATLVPAAPPVTNTSMPTATLLPTNTPEPTATPTIAPSATPTFVFPTPQFVAELLEPGITVDASNEPFALMFYFYGYEGDLATIQVDSLSQSPIYLRDEANNALEGCERKGNTVCVIEKYQLPYTGIYYVLVDRLPSEFHIRIPCKEKKAPPTWCTKGGPFKLNLTIE